MTQKKTNKTIWIIALISGALLFIALIVGGIAIYSEVNEPTWEEEQQMLEEKATLSAEEAEAIALSEVPGTVISSSLDDEGFSRVVYNVTIQTETGTQVEVQVDATTGSVIESELED